MAYRVELTNPAQADADLAFERIREVAPISAERWLRGLFAVILTLSDMPARSPLIPEADELGVPLRHLIYGRRSASFRIIFDMQEQSPVGPRVRILRIWRGARHALNAQDIEAQH